MGTVTMENSIPQKLKKQNYHNILQFQFWEYIKQK